MHGKDLVASFYLEVLSVSKVIEKIRTQTERLSVERTVGMEARKENYEIIPESYRKKEPVKGSQVMVFQVEGITCTNCAAKFERNLRAIPGVTKATLNIRTGKLIVEGVGDLETFEAVRDQGRIDNYILSLIELKLF